MKLTLQTIFTIQNDDGQVINTLQTETNHSCKTKDAKSLVNGMLDIHNEKVEQLKRNLLKKI